MTHRKTHAALRAEGEVTGLTRALGIVNTTSTAMSAHDALCEVKERLLAKIREADSAGTGNKNNGNRDG